MKKYAVAALWVFAVSMMFVLNIIPIAEATSPLLDRTLSLSTLSSELKSPDAIAKYMWKHFLFEPDQRLFGKSEHWQKPEDFLEKGKGDCEDFAIFAKSMLQKIGIQSFLLNIYTNGSGHTVCAFLENGTYSVIDGTDVVRTKATDLQGLMNEIEPFWQSGAIVAQSGDHGRVLQTITR